MGLFDSNVVKPCPSPIPDGFVEFPAVVFPAGDGKTPLMTPVTTELVSRLDREHSAYVCINSKDQKILAQNSLIPFLNTLLAQKIAPIRELRSPLIDNQTRSTPAETVLTIEDRYWSSRYIREGTSIDHFEQKPPLPMTDEAGSSWEIVSDVLTDRLVAQIRWSVGDSDDSDIFRKGPTGSYYFSQNLGAVQRLSEVLTIVGNSLKLDGKSNEQKGLQKLSYQVDAVRSRIMGHDNFLSAFWQRPWVEQFGIVATSLISLWGVGRVAFGYFNAHGGARLFISDARLVAHPIQTAKKVWEAIKEIASKDPPDGPPMAGSGGHPFVAIPSSSETTTESKNTEFSWANVDLDATTVALFIAAGILAIADGPFPFGDAAGASLVSWRGATLAARGLAIP